MKKPIAIIVSVFITLLGTTLYFNKASDIGLKIGAGVTAQGFLSQPVSDPISPTSPTSASCGLGGSGALSSIDGTTRIARLTWTTTSLTAGLISADNGWWGYVPQTINSTASESFSVPITGATKFTMVTSSGRATSTCSVTLS